MDLMRTPLYTPDKSDTDLAALDRHLDQEICNLLDGCDYDLESTTFRLLVWPLFATRRQIRLELNQRAQPPTDTAAPNDPARRDRARSEITQDI